LNHHQSQPHQHLNDDNATQQETTHLVIGENQRISNNNILPPASRENHNLRNIVWRQRFAARVHGVGFALVAVEANDAELRLDLAGINLNHADARRDQLLAHGVCDATHGGFGRAVDRAIGVWLAASDGADVDDIACASLAAGLHLWQHGLRYIDETSHIRRKHDIHIFSLDIADFVNTAHEPGIIDQNVDLLELLGQVLHELGDFIRLGNV
jgi:hypothetical protein